MHPIVLRCGAALERGTVDEVLLGEVSSTLAMLARRGEHRGALEALVRLAFRAHGEGRAEAGRLLTVLERVLVRDREVTAPSAWRPPVAPTAATIPAHRFIEGRRRLR